MTLRALLKVTSRLLLDLHSTFVIGARLRVSDSLVDCIKSVLVRAGVALVGDRVENVYTIEAPLHSTHAVNILAARS